MSSENGFIGGKSSVQSASSPLRPIQLIDVRLYPTNSRLRSCLSAASCSFSVGGARPLRTGLERSFGGSVVGGEDLSGARRGQLDAGAGDLRDRRCSHSAEHPAVPRRRSPRHWIPGGVLAHNPLPPKWIPHRLPQGSCLRSPLLPSVHYGLHAPAAAVRSKLSIYISKDSSAS